MIWRRWPYLIIWGKVILVGTEEYQPSEKLLPVRIYAVPEPWEAITSVLVPQALTLSMIE
jgi:glucosamine--fructose-6-phosphate aminotransferase (isomerizing)